MSPDASDVSSVPSLLDMLGGGMGGGGGQANNYWASPGRSGGIDANSLMNYVTSTFGGQGPAAYSGEGSPAAAANWGGTGATSWNNSYPMSAEATKFMNQQRFPVDPNRIVYTGGGFRLDNTQGPDLFGGKFNPETMPLAQIPRELQPLLAPSLVRFYKGQGDYHGGAVRGHNPASWTGFFAPPEGASRDTGAFAQSPGMWSNFDPWGRYMGNFANLLG